MSMAVLVGSARQTENNVTPSTSPCSRKKRGANPLSLRERGGGEGGLECNLIGKLSSVNAFLTKTRYAITTLHFAEIPFVDRSLVIQIPGTSGINFPLQIFAVDSD